MLMSFPPLCCVCSELLARVGVFSLSLSLPAQLFLLNRVSSRIFGQSQLESSSSSFYFMEAFLLFIDAAFFQPCVSLLLGSKAKQTGSITTAEDGPPEFNSVRKKRGRRLHRNFSFFLFSIPCLAAGPCHELAEENFYDDVQKYEGVSR